MDLIEQDLLDQPRDIVEVHMYLAPDENPAEILPLFKERLEASGVEYKLETSGIEQEDWQNAWKKYYTPWTLASAYHCTAGTMILTEL